MNKQALLRCLRMTRKLVKEQLETWSYSADQWKRVPVKSEPCNPDSFIMSSSTEEFKRHIVHAFDHTPETIETQSIEASHMSLGFIHGALWARGLVTLSSLASLTTEAEETTLLDDEDIRLLLLWASWHAKERVESTGMETFASRHVKKLAKIHKHLLSESDLQLILGEGNTDD